MSIHLLPTSPCNSSSTSSNHTFHIPVMGTGFTIDTPIHAARYGISSVVSLTDDGLIEDMRRVHCERTGEVYEPISDKEDDSRARRITAYLDLMDRVVARQVETLQASPFEPGSEITRYFELLPDGSLKQAYEDMLATADPDERARRQDALRPLATPGNIDANIMTKLDIDSYRGSEKLPAEFCEAVAALRGFANSTLRSSIVFSAGLNPRLYTYTAQFPDFLPDADGLLKKKVILKVSDYRSALIQGKFLAKRGVWISEYRIESGLNCGGHAFVADGMLMGPILEEFRLKKPELVAEMQAIYTKALSSRGITPRTDPYPVRITVQGGITTADEDALLRERFGADGTGWGTPFLLVPEVTNVDDEHLKKLAAATDDDVHLSGNSPLNTPFWALRDSASELDRREQIRQGNPGSTCPKGFARSNTDYTELPICLASRAYQQRFLSELPNMDYTDEQREVIREATLQRSCICRDLAGGATLKNGIEETATTAICPGPSIADFDKVATLEEMVGHIYGRLSLITKTDRPHMLVRELMLYVDYLRKESDLYTLGLSTRTSKYFREFRTNLLNGIAFYRGLASQITEDCRKRFLERLGDLEAEIEEISDRIAA